MTFYLKYFDMKCMGGEVLLLIILFSSWVESLFTYKPMCLYVKGAPARTLICVPSNLPIGRLVSRFANCAAQSANYRSTLDITTLAST